MKTTLNKIRAHSPHTSVWRNLLNHLGKTEADDEPLSLLSVLESNGLDDALWCLRTLPEYDKHWRLYAVWCARQVQHLITDERNLKALDVAEAYAQGNATDAELKSASYAARSVTRSLASSDFTADVFAATSAASYAASTAADYAASESAFYAARVASRKDQINEFIKLIKELDL